MLISTTKYSLRIAATVLAFAGPVLAADPVEQHNSSAFWFVNWIGLTNATLKVVSPDGEVETIFAASGTPVFELNRANALDGVYRYELSAATEKTVKVINRQNDGRGDQSSDQAAEPYYVSGQFLVSRGVIVIPEDVVEQDG
jgi:hypothetical protein